VELTGVIHPYAANPFSWRRVQPDGKWPEPVSGLVDIQKVRERCLQIDRTVGFMDEVEPGLKALLEPEMQREMGEMVEAMKRVRAVVYG
jgi:hypothetical protein